MIVIPIQMDVNADLVEGFQKWGAPRWLILEHRVKTDDFRAPPFWETFTMS